MAGFKSTVKAFKPMWFITFDSDPLVRGNGIFDQPTLIDEMGNTEVLIHNEDDQYTGYMAGLDSLVEPEQHNQHSIMMPANTRAPDLLANGKSYAPCTIFEVPMKQNSVDDWTKDEFTLVWLMRRNSYAFDGWTFKKELNKPPYVDRLDETVFRLGNIIEFNAYHYRQSTSTGEIKMLFDESGNSLLTETYYPRGYHEANFSAEPVANNRTSLCIIRWKNGVMQYWVDGHLRYEKNLRSVRGYDATKHSINQLMKLPRAGEQFDEMFFFFGGKPTNKIRTELPKWQIVAQTYLDQIALFDRALKDDEMVRLYRRTWFRSTMYLKEDPYTYVMFNDKSQNIQNKDSIVMQRGRGTYTWINISGAPSSVICEEDGKYTGEKAMYFPEYGLHFYGGGDSLRIANGYDFTMEFSFKGGNSSRTCIWQLVEVNGKWKMELWGNSRDGEFSRGFSDFKFGKTGIKTFHYDLFNSQWNRIIIRKSGNVLDVWVNEEQVVSNVKMTDLPETGTLFNFLTAIEDGSQTGGFLSEFLIYQKALEDQIISAHTNYDNLYRVYGQVVRLGQPFKGTIRVYSHRTGQLLAETVSDATTGEYRVDLSSNDYVDLMLLGADDETARIRAVGVVNPDIVNDLTLTFP